MPSEFWLGERRRFEKALAWSGGAAFVLSLGFFAYTYGVTLARPRPDGLPPALAAAADTALFALFALHHSVLARPGTKRRLAAWVPPRLERTLFVWVASVLLALVCAAWRPIPALLYAHTGLAAWAHWAVVAAGGILVAAAARRLDPLDLAGIVQATGRRRAARSNHLVVRWPYNLVRHPIYLGWVLVVFGVPRMTGDRLLFACLSTVYLLIAIPLEERLLVAEFGDAYRRYRRQVRWRIVPLAY
jgi:methanethiol S-methyltransferase